jgi:hypothetical protein
MIKDYLQTTPFEINKIVGIDLGSSINLGNYLNTKLK